MGVGIEEEVSSQGKDLCYFSLVSSDVFIDIFQEVSFYGSFVYV